MSSPEPIMRELRAARPAAPAELRERVRALPEPRAPRPVRLPPLRALAATAALGAAAALAAAMIHGIVSSGSRADHEAAPTPELRTVPAAKNARQTTLGKLGTARAPASADSIPNAPAQLPTNRSRLQQYDVTLRVGVKDTDELSETTREAMQTARRLGGYVASANYNTPGGKRGESTLVLRVPVGRLNDAIASLSGLGTILAQRLSIEDVQRQVDVESRTIRKLRKQAARLRAAIAATADPVQRERLREQLEYVVAQVEALQRQRAQTVKNARLARISLVLAVRHKAAANHESRLERTLDDAASVLAREGEILLYALIVAGPLLLLGAAAVATGRTWNRRADRRLLERT